MSEGGGSGGRVQREGGREGGVSSADFVMSWSLKPTFTRASA